MAIISTNCGFHTFVLMRFGAFPANTNVANTQSLALVNPFLLAYLDYSIEYRRVLVLVPTARATTVSVKLVDKF